MWAVSSKLGWIALLIIGLAAVVLGSVGAVVFAFDGQPGGALGFGLAFVGAGAAFTFVAWSKLQPRRQGPPPPGSGPEGSTGGGPGQVWSWAQVVDEVTRAFAESPYLLTDDQDRVQVIADLADPRFDAGPGAGRSNVFIAEVVHVGPGRAMLRDGTRSITWVVGADGADEARFAGEATWVSGRIWSARTSTTYAAGSDGVQVTDSSAFSTRELHDPIKAVLNEAGWQVERSREEKIGLIFAVIGGVGALVTLIVLLIGLLLGKF